MSQGHLIVTGSGKSGVTTFDIVIIGGGINGCGIARDAAGRGLRVMLAEKGDLAGGTSSASTKLIHGGLRYLEMYAFSMVRAALREREVLLQSAPHIIWPLRFVLPHHSGLRPRWLIRLGLFLYDHLGGRQILKGSRKIDLNLDPAGAPLQNKYSVGFSYSDCWVDDARLVVLNAVDAAKRGAEIFVSWEVIEAKRLNGLWWIKLRNTHSGEHTSVSARVLVNGAGPWVGEVLSKVVGISSRSRLRHVKGSHIVVGKLFDHDSAYIFQNDDGRIVFAIPYEDDFTLIGTTDTDYEGALDRLEISAQESAYLCRSVSAYFKVPISSRDVVWSYSGVRPLYFEEGNSAQATTRDFVIEREGKNGEAPLISIFGGKITSYRHLAEDVLSRLCDVFPDATNQWTGKSFLPGGDFPVGGSQSIVDELFKRSPALSAEVCKRLVRCYGTLSYEIFDGAVSSEDLGEHFGSGLYEREVEYLVTREWARTSDDILWRRTKLGLRLNKTQVERLSKWLEDFHAR